MKYTQAKPYLPTGGMNPDPAGQLIGDNQASSIINMRSSGTALITRSGSTRLGTNGLASPALAFHTYQTPAGSELYFAFTKNNIYKYNFTTGLWVSCISVAFTSEVSFWSITNFVDLTLGPIIVAAGSNPPLEDLPETDGAQRELRSYTPSTGLFDPLQLNEQLPVVFEKVGTIASTAAQQWFSVAHGTAVGYFSIATLENGVLAYVENAATSYAHFNKTPGGGIFTGGVYNGATFDIFISNANLYGKDLYASYTYKNPTQLKPRFVWNYSNRLVCANFYEPSSTTLPYPTWRIRYGNPGDVSALYTYNYQELITVDTTPITGGEKLGEYLYIFKKDSIHKISYVGGALILSTQCVWTDGTTYGRTIKAIDNIIYYLGKDDVYAFDGNIPETLTMKKADNKIREEIIRGILPTKVRQIHGSYDPYNNEYCIWIPNATIPSRTHPTTCYVYSLKYGTWSKFSSIVEVSATGIGKLTQGASSNAIRYPMLGAASSTYSGYIYIVDSTSTTDFSTNGTDGLAITSTLVTKDFTFDTPMLQDRVQRLEIEAGGTAGGVLQVFWDGTLASLPAYSPGTILLTASILKYNYHPDAVVDQIRFRLTSTTALTLRTLIAYALDCKKTNE